MDAHLNSVMAREHRADLWRAAQASRLTDGNPATDPAHPRVSLIARLLSPRRRYRLAGAMRLPPAGGAAAASAVTLRLAVAADFPALNRLAELDSRPALRHPVLVAVVGVELRAAISLADGSVTADPFQRTAGVVALLRERARQFEDDRHAAANAPRTTSTLALRAARSQ